MLFFAIIIGILLFAWVHRTRMGMIVRAGVDDRAMVSALGINIERVFAIFGGLRSVLPGDLLRATRAGRKSLTTTTQSHS